ncbi:hypothetical protein [Enterococcus thailandicus]|uniref:hypothetical protein n=1 Tax=Enterococcus thailandicus TaxID=417368 RepID=UPI00244D97FB|nr:hypothetical protein [Enterococcus thailandicus]GMC00416.1 hypothetical protein K2F_06750 [Enterococcus thailandicus]
MKQNITVHYPNTTTTSSSEFELDEFCPHCGNPGTHTLYASMTSNPFNNIENSVSLFLQCPRRECNKFHIQEFPFTKISEDSARIKSVEPKLTHTYRVKLDNTLPDLVNNNFPNFKSIYEQSLEAESQGLDQIAGVGFRKSIEFLIKEYVISQDPSSSEEVKSKFLGKVINENLSEFPKIQALAKAAVWIGNDETHFVRVHDDKDIQDMKGFLTAAALFISAELKVEEALEFTNRPKS